MNVQPIFGLEFEVAFAAMDAHGHRVGPSLILNEFMNEAMSSLTFLPSHGSSGVFLENGSRLYLDCGKPEITTPEVLTPADACRYSRACEEILLDVTRRLVERSSGVREIVLSRSNICYGGSCNAWACHESYGHRASSGSLANHFIPHAVSRIIYTGAGGFDNRSHALQFLVSPRVAHLTTSISENTQRNRAIFNTKDESLANDQYQRLHVICGENISSLLAQWLKMGTTAIVVAMVEAGLSPAAGLGLRQPVKAMRTFAEDPSLTATAALTSGEKLTAIEIQRRILQSAKGLSVNGTFGQWLPTCLELWESTLDRLQQGPEAVQRTFDWAIKLEMFRRHAQGRGIPWDRLSRWNKILRRLDQTPMTPEEAEMRFALLRSPRQTASLLKDWAHVARENNLDWDELDSVLKLRQELFELDTRFGQLGENGIFNRLDQAGLLDHAAPGVENIEAAKTNPPSEGRASVRGAVIKRLARRGGSTSCEWRGMWDYDNRKYLDLSDPFTSSESWTALPESREPSSSAHSLRLRRTFSHATTLYDRGEYESAARMLDMIREWHDMLRVPIRRDLGRVTAWVQARRGYLEGSGELARVHEDTLSLQAVCDYLNVYRFQGLLPSREMFSFCEQGLELIAANNIGPDPADVLLLKGHNAYRMLCDGQLEEAIEAYEEVLRPDQIATLHRRSHARMLTEKAEALRQLQRHEQAESLLATAKQIQVHDHFHGDLNDFTQTRRAKLTADQGNPSEALGMLADVFQTQNSMHNVMGEARTRLLMARLQSRAEAESGLDQIDDIKGRLLQLQARRPALTQCRLLRKILSQWEIWIQGEMVDDEKDFYWKL